jgi:hypothetical protein
LLLGRAHTLTSTYFLLCFISQNPRLETTLSVLSLLQKEEHIFRAFENKILRSEVKRKNKGIGKKNTVRNFTTFICQPVWIIVRARE